MYVTELRPVAMGSRLTPGTVPEVVKTPLAGRGSGRTPAVRASGIRKRTARAQSPRARWRCMVKLYHTPAIGFHAFRFGPKRNEISALPAERALRSRKVPAIGS